MEPDYPFLQAIIDRVNLIYVHREREHYVDLLGDQWEQEWHERREPRNGT